MANLFPPFGGKANSYTLIEDVAFQDGFAFLSSSRRCKPISGGSDNRRLGDFRLIKQAIWMLI